METDLLRDRVFDTVGICQRTDRPKFLGFLSLEETAFVENTVSKLKANYKFFGGYQDAQRVMLGCFPEWECEWEFPITAITLTFRKNDSLTHRDILGSLMALGLKRETVGDILIETARAVVFLTDETTDYVINQITKIGRVGVEIKKGFKTPLPAAGVLSDFSSTVSSERLDCVVAALIGASRKTACEKIEQALVSVNSIVSQKPTLKVRAGDVVTVRSKGKFIVDSIEDKTKKDRLILRYKKYV
jgi:RNA-binding protein YlmH